MIRSFLLSSLILSVAPQGVFGAPLDPHDMWFTGCWEFEDGSTREVWSEPEGIHLFGYSVSYEHSPSTTSGKTVTFFETMRIELAPSGDYPVAFFAYPSGKGPTRFEQTAHAPHAVTFENPQNDYPQRIRYWRDGTHLKAEISTLQGEQIRQFDYRPCSID